MSDKLKKFIQRSKTQFDLEEPRLDLFDNIMQKVSPETKMVVAPKPLFNKGFRWMAIAATIALLIACTLFLYKPDHKIESSQANITVKPVEQIPESQESTSPVTPEVKSISQQIPKGELNNQTQLKSNSNIKNKATHKIQSITKSEEPVQIAGQTEDKNNIKSSEPQNVVQELTSIANSEKPVSINTATDSQANMPFEKIQNQVPNSLVSTMPEGAKVIMPQPTRQVKKTRSIARHVKPDTKVNDNSDDNSSLAANLGKGFLGFLSSEAKKLAGNTLSIKKVDNEEQTVLAVHIKNEKFELNKEIKLGNF